MACLLLTVNSKTRNSKINFVFTNTTRRKISEINCFKTVFNCIKHSKNHVFLCQAIPGGFWKSLKMVFYTGQTKPRKSQKEHILVSRKSLILGFAKHSTFSFFKPEHRSPRDLKIEKSSRFEGNFQKLVVNLLNNSKFRIIY